MKRITFLLPLVLGLFLNPVVAAAQTNAEPANGFTLEQCLAFALQNRPSVQLAALDEEIAEREIKASLAGWLPQVGVQYNLRHYLKMPVTLLALDGGTPTPRTLGVANTSTLSLQANQTLYSNDVLQASRAARFIRIQNNQNTLNTKINTVVTVSKAFYDVLLTQEQLRILDEAIIRQEKQLKDARAQYEQGLVDKTDFQRASITLSNIRSDRKRNLEASKYKLTLLKELMGLNPEKPLQLVYDYRKMEGNIPVDTTAGVSFANRIEYQQLQTQKQLQALSVNYYRWGFLPNVSAFGNYNLVNQNKQFGDLFNQAFPNALVGLSVGLPIFQGTRRIQNLRRAELINQSLDLEITSIRNRISSEYDLALTSYKSDLYEWLATRNNVALAEDVYRIIKVQYNEGIKTYLDLITAETDLRVTQLNYYNALYRVLASKLDLQRAQGTISVI